MGRRAKAALSFEIPMHPANLIRHDEEMRGCLGIPSIQNNSNNHIKSLTAFVRTSLPLGRLFEALGCINTHMFTFGREHEKKCEPRYVRNPEQVPLLLAVVDGVHDLIEGKGTEEPLKKSLRKAFIEGGSGDY